MSSIQTAHKRIIRTLCLVAIVIFGFLTTLGSGGGGGDSTTPPPPQITADCVWAPTGGTDTTWNNCNWQ